VPLYHRVTDWEPCDPDAEGAEYRRIDGCCDGWARPVDRFVQEDNAQRVERDDTGKGLGAVSGTFQLITHEEMGQIMEPVLADPGCKLDTMGSVKEGRMVYATVLLDEPYEIKGDVDGFGDPVLTLPYFAIINSHDGTGACKGLYTQVRIVCANTVQASAADGDRHGAQFILRHTSGVKTRLESARDVIKGCRVEASKWREMAEGLATIPVDATVQMQFLNEFIPEPPADVVSDRVRANVARDRTAFLHVLRDSATNCAMPNALGLLNAAVEWADHLRGFRNRETYMGRQILSAEPMKGKALSLVRDLVGASA
jgi:phage/plasmid-like protein (TIGR03299 family)